MKQHFMKKPENERNYLLREISSATTTRVQQQTDLMESIRRIKYILKLYVCFKYYLSLNVKGIFTCFKSWEKTLKLTIIVLLFYYISEDWVVNISDGPDEITFEPNPSIQKNQLFTVREGETIGPYQCIVDCNPPCNITWEYMDANGYRQSIPQRRIMLQQHANRKIKSYFCVAEWKSQPIKEKEITLYVKCKLLMYLYCTYFEQIYS